MPAKPNPERDQRIRKMVAQGLDDRIIATRLGMSRDGARDARARLGLAPNHDPLGQLRA